MQTIRISQLNLPVKEDAASAPGQTEKERQALLLKKAARMLHVRPEMISSLTIVRHGIDARKKPDILHVYSVDVTLAKGGISAEEVVRKCKDPRVRAAERPAFSFPSAGRDAAARMAAHAGGDCRPVIVGSGPAGLFAAYLLAEHGHKPLLLERGRCAEERTRDVRRFWESGELSPSSNVQFGEGGAGTFSDGKLYTSVKDREGFFSEILRIFVAHGAPEEILYEAHPHIGTDCLVKILKSMRERMLAAGADIRFETQMTGLVTEQLSGESAGASGSGPASGRKRRITGILTDKGEISCARVILAIGHSARDTYEMLHAEGIAMEAKPFAAGFRIAHPQHLINEAMYGIADPKTLSAAPYKLTYRTASGRSVYSFCMCPGGYIINASSEEGRLCVNGMSYADRGGRYANSAIVVNVTPEDAGPELLLGIAFQRRMEEAAFLAGVGAVPVSDFAAFRKGASCAEQGQPPEGGGAGGGMELSGEVFRGKAVSASLNGILPRPLEEALVEGILQFDRTIPGFAGGDALLAAVESRTSAPLRMVRDAADLQSVSLSGLYPCGEGAGYAGGIMSAAADGIRCAKACAASFVS
ncbi:MAG: NAD(P)-binding protein [Lachnospiraceae bacterium]|nr:NAD(P)-binding protein [Lachnospiraceae bacterium]